MEDNLTINQTMPNEVLMSYRRAIRERFDTLLRAKGLKYPEFYKPLGFNKVVASLMRNGIWIPPVETQIKVALAFGVDSKTIWGDAR